MTRIASSATIESMRAAVLVPHLARCGFDVVVAIVTVLSCALCKCADACPLNATDTPTYAPSSVVEDRGTTVPTALTLMMSFVKLNTLLN